MRVSNGAFSSQSGAKDRSASGITRTENKAVQVTEEFAETTGIHGIGHIARGNRLHGVVWTIICLAGFGMLVYQVETAIQTYYAYPVTTWVQSGVKDRLFYPAVTLCNEAAVTSQADELIGSKHLLESNISLPLRLLLETDHKIRNNEITEDPDDIRIPYRNLTVDIKTMILNVPLHEKALIGFKLEDMLFRCVFANKRCNESDFVRFSNFRYGNCYTFNAAVPGRKTLIANRGGAGSGTFIRIRSHDFVKSSDINHSVTGAVTESFANGQRSTAILHKSAGLELILLVRQFNYVHLSTNAAGFRIVIHNPTEMPFPEQQGIYLAPGFLTGISMVKTLLSSAPPPYTQCIEESEMLREWQEMGNLYNDMLPGLKYDQRSCMYTHYQRQVKKQCGCFDPSFPKPKEARLDMDPKCNILGSQVLDCMTDLWNDFLEKKDYANYCMPPCQQTDYTFSTSQSYWPATSSEEPFKKIAERRFPEIAKQTENMTFEQQSRFIRNNFLKVQIFYKDTTYEQSITKPKYTTLDLLSNIGSQISLWLGMSVISGFEIVEYLIELWFVLWNRQRPSQKKVISSEGN